MLTSRSGYSTDVVAKKIFSLLLRDFRSLLGNDFAHGAEQAFREGIKQFRAYDWPALGFISPLRFKAWMQMKHLLKRHLFEADVYDTKTLEEKTINAFLSNQEYYLSQREATPRTFAVLQEARSICKKTLGKVDCDELASYANIGRRATLGNPLSDSFLDKKMGDIDALTCSTEAKEWFFTIYLAGDRVLRTIVKSIFAKAKIEHRKIPLSVDFLKLVLVPKSWKTLRPITPLTCVGLFLSYCIGGVVTSRLKSVLGLDISKLQSQHRLLAKKFSVTRSHVTADLSSASDSIMSQHLNSVLPRAWYRLVRQTFIRQLLVNGVPCYTSSVLPMGNGATFPIETLFFYSLIRAIGNLLNVKGTYSVYGDDLIYPRKIHRHVCVVLRELGIRINEDKTCVNSHFRESCGGDFYHGVDVRPFLMPENPSIILKGNHYAAYLYKIYNSITLRWKHEEVQSTLHYILSELSVTQTQVFRVPLHFPDTSGIKCKDPLLLGTSWTVPWSLPEGHFTDGRICVTFRYLGPNKPEGHIVTKQDVYYWDSLRSMSLRQPPNWRWWGTFFVERPSQRVRSSDLTVRRVWIKPIFNEHDRIPGHWVYQVPGRSSNTLVAKIETLSYEFWDTASTKDLT